MSRWKKKELNKVLQAGKLDLAARSASQNRIH